MKLKCMKCELIKELSKEELEEVGTFVLNRKLRAVGFLKFLSLDMRDLCKDQREHQWEFEPTFDKEVHSVAKEIADAIAVVTASVLEQQECDRKIAEFNKRKDEAKAKENESEQTKSAAEVKLKEIAFLPDASLWTAA